MTHMVPLLTLPQLLEKIKEHRTNHVIHKTTVLFEMEVARKFGEVEWALQQIVTNLIEEQNQVMAAFGFEEKK